MLGSHDIVVECTAAIFFLRRIATDCGHKQVELSDKERGKGRFHQTLQFIMDFQFNYMGCQIIYIKLTCDL